MTVTLQQEHEIYTEVTPDSYVILERSEGPVLFKCPDALAVVEALSSYIKDGSVQYTHIWRARGDKIIKPDDSEYTDFIRVNGISVPSLANIEFPAGTIEQLAALGTSVDFLQINVVIDQDGNAFLVLNKVFRNLEVAAAGHTANPIQTKTELIALPPELAGLILKNMGSLNNLLQYLLTDTQDASVTRPDYQCIADSGLDACSTDSQKALTYSISLLQQGYNNRINQHQIINAIWRCFGLNPDNLPLEYQEAYNALINTLSQNHQDGYVRNGISFVRQDLEYHKYVDADGNESTLILSADGEIYLYLLTSWNGDNFPAAEAILLQRLIIGDATNPIDEAIRGQGGGGLSGVTKGKKRTKNIPVHGDERFVSLRAVIGNKIIFLNAVGSGESFDQLADALRTELNSILETDSITQVQLDPPATLAVPASNAEALAYAGRQAGQSSQSETTSPDFTSLPSATIPVVPIDPPNSAAVQPASHEYIVNSTPTKPFSSPTQSVQITESQSPPIINTATEIVPFSPSDPTPIMPLIGHVIATHLSNSLFNSEDATTATQVHHNFVAASVSEKNGSQKTTMTAFQTWHDASGSNETTSTQSISFQDALNLTTTDSQVPEIVSRSGVVEKIAELPIEAEHPTITSTALLTKQRTSNGTNPVSLGNTEQQDFTLPVPNIVFTNSTDPASKGVSIPVSQHSATAKHVLPIDSLVDTSPTAAVEEIPFSTRKPSARQDPRAHSGTQKKATRPKQASQLRNAPSGLQGQTVDRAVFFSPGSQTATKHLRAVADPNASALSSSFTSLQTNTITTTLGDNIIVNPDGTVTVTQDCSRQIQDQLKAVGVTVQGQPGRVTLVNSLHTAERVPVAV